MTPCNVASNLTHLAFIISVPDIMISGKTSKLNGVKLCFLLRAPSLREISYLNKESSKQYKGEV
jgi:hypothetical protein